VADTGTAPGDDDGDRFAALERELRSSRDALQLALQVGRMGIWSWDLATDEVVWDDVMCALFGLDHAPADFDEWLACLHPDDRERSRQTAIAAMQAGKGYDLVHRVVLPDGSVRHLDGRADVILGDDGSVIGLRGVTLDCTDRETARLRAERLARYSQLVADAGVVLAATLDPEQVVRRLLDLVVPALADGCEVVLVEHGGLRRMVRAEGVDPERLRRRERNRAYLTDDHPISKVLRTGRTVRLDAGEGSPESAFGPASDDTTSSSFGITEAVIVPMTVRGDVIGALALGIGPSGRRLDGEVVTAAAELAARAALCFDNATLFCQQRSIADTLQRSLVPETLPSLSWLQLAGRYWVPGTGTEVGGDFYDSLLGREEVTLLIGDVCGKGIEAASLTALARHTLRTAMNHIGDLVVALSWLHDSFRAQAPGSFVTAAVVRLRPGPDGRVRGQTAIGGHPRPLIVRAGGSTELLEPGGTAPGLPVYRAAPVVTFDLGPGDTLILYTDGVTDVPGEGALTTDELRALVADAATGDADEIATGIGAALERIRPRRARTDDIALLVAKVPG
jgi:serine phosphatase RsbU (regulator of sigma subunit)